MNHLDHLTSLVDLDGSLVVDIGAGNGKFARAFARCGARVIGIEIDEEKVRIARQAHHPHVEIRLGRGERLPLDDMSADLACFMFSFHHIPLDLQDKALAEAHRVLKHDGRLHALDPRPGGPMSEVMRPLDDETLVRTESQARLDRLGGHGGFALVSKIDYEMITRSADFQTYLDGVVAVDPRRTALLPGARDEMQATFARLGRKTADGIELPQPCVAYHFQKAGSAACAPQG